mmetsp:Transcript_12514/g.29847  ORF Transcript_12514/g.29847 Transcript_12514/m.29847 type:complete len:356 (+) Transcript_12514:104-1171(+)
MRNIIRMYASGQPATWPLPQSSISACPSCSHFHLMRERGDSKVSKSCPATSKGGDSARPVSISLYKILSARGVFCENFGLDGSVTAPARAAVAAALAAAAEPGRLARLRPLAGRLAERLTGRLACPLSRNFSSSVSVGALVSRLSESAFEPERDTATLTVAAEPGRLLVRLLCPLTGRPACTFSCSFSASFSASALTSFLSDSADGFSCFAGVAAPVEALSASSFEGSSSAASTAAVISTSAGLRFITTTWRRETFLARARGIDWLLKAGEASMFEASSPPSSPKASYLCSRRRMERLQHRIALDRGRHVRVFPWLGGGPKSKDAKTWEAVSFSTAGFRPRGHGFMASWLSTMTA